jgi:amino acid transporter
MNQLRRGLSTRDQLVVGISGAVGTGVLFSTAGMAALAGPGMVLAWLFGAIMYAFVMLTYVELAQVYPEAGGPARYSLYTYGALTNMIAGFANLVWYVFIPPIEALATVEGINYFWPQLINASGNPTILGGVLSAVFLLLFVPFNYYGIKGFAKSTNLLGIIKLILYVVAALGFIAVAHFSNFTAFHGGAMPFGMNGVFVAIPLGMFAFGGIRVIADYSEEISNPDQVRASFVRILVGQTVVYLLFGIAFVVSLNWSNLKLAAGNWGAVSSIAGNPFLTIAHANSMGWIIPLTIVIAILGPFVTGYIYQGAGSRVLMAMSRSGIVSSKLREVSQDFAIPAGALLALAIIGAVLAFIFAPVPGIYSLINDAVVGGYIAFAPNSAIMFALRRNGRTGLAKGGPWIAGIAFAVISLIIYWSGWPSVPYAVALIALGSLVFGLVYKTGTGLRQALWYMVYIVFLTAMTYVGGVGRLSLFNIDVGSLIVAVVSLVVFLPWAIASRLPKDAADAMYKTHFVATPTASQGA